jgi:fumarate reductase flavoprotein subunit
VRDERQRLERDVLGKTGGRERIADIRDQMQKILEESAGIYRDGAKLAWAVGCLRELQDRAANLAIEDHSRTFNTERVAALELSCMLDVAEAIAQSALRREESRGAHQRTDFPARDDRRFLAHSLISRTSDRSARVEYLPVRITRWPPAERVYGEVTPHAETDHAAGRAISTGAGV